MFHAHLESAKQELGFKGQLKPKQEEALAALYSNKDVFCMLPTGYGKSLIFQLSPFLLGQRDSCDAITLIVTPLNSIMQDQVMKLCKNNVMACYLNMLGTNGETFCFQSSDKSGTLSDGSDSEDGDEDDALVDNDEDAAGDADNEHAMKIEVPLADIKAGNYRLVYAHPEAFLSSAAGRNLLRSGVYQQRVRCVAIDEAHMIYEWGESFRKDFGRLQEILALFSVPALVVTATASPVVQKKIQSDLALTNAKVIATHPDRPNIMYFKKQRLPSLQQKDDIDVILNGVVKGLKEEGRKYPMTIMYCDLEVVSYAYRYLEEGLKEAQYIGEAIPENRLFAQYHQAYTESMKTHITSELGKEESKVRFVVATVALGMGLDAPSIRNVIHFRNPTSIERYLQETGRAGRDGKPADVTLYYNNTDLRRNRPGLQPAMIEYCRSKDKCMRQMLMEYLDFCVSADRIMCRCCDVCKERCDCEECFAKLTANLIV